MISDHQWYLWCATYCLNTTACQHQAVNYGRDCTSFAWGGGSPTEWGEKAGWLLEVPALNAPCDSPVQLAAAAAAHPTLLFRTGTQHDTPPDLPVSDRHWNHTIT